MANNQPYQSTWNGAMVQTPTNQTPPMPPQPANNMYAMPTQSFMNYPQMPMMQPNPLTIAIVQSEAAVDNFMVERGVTAFLINYSEGIFWTKRQKDDGLGYETIKHVFFKSDDYEKQNQNKPSDTDILQVELDNLRSDLEDFKREFQEFIK